MRRGKLGSAEPRRQKRTVARIEGVILLVRVVLVSEPLPRAAVRYQPCKHRRLPPREGAVVFQAPRTTKFLFF